MPEPLHTRSIVDAVEDGLRREILTGAVEPGSAVTELGIAGLFGVGRPTAKAAIDRVAADGLLTRDGRRSYSVPTIGLEDVADLYQSRLMIESGANSVLAQRREVPAAARLANAGLRHAAALGDAPRVVAADVEFHLTLVRTVGSQRLVRMHSSLMAEAHFTMARVQTNQLLRADVIADEHDEILERIEDGDGVAAVATTRAHLLHARDKLLATMRDSARELLDGDPDSFS